MNVLLWILQIFLALMFTFAGVAKFLTPAEEMAANMTVPLPIWFIYFIGAVEILGAVGLIVPWLTGIKPSLTSLAAWGLVIIMIGATFVSAIGSLPMAIFPLVIGVLCFIVARGRSGSAK